MTATEASLRSILSGGGPETTKLLHNCRFEGAGTRSYGRETILEDFQRAPIRLTDSIYTASARFAALVGTSDGSPVALIADLYRGNIARLWYLAHHPLTLRSDPRLDVPYDFDLSQQPEELAFDPQDHPDLAPAHCPHVLEVAKPFLPLKFGGGPIPTVQHRRLARSRLIVLRAFSAADAAVVLLTVHAFRVDGVAGTVQFNAVGLVAGESAAGMRLVVDEASCAAELARAWTPTL